MDGSNQTADPGTGPGTLTFLFTDLAGSTRLWERFPEAMGAALARHDGILRGAIEASGGRVVKTTGDGMMAVFDTAADAVAASLAAQRGLAAESWGETGALQVRMGLHAGEAERRADDYFGPTVNRTARLMAVAHGGQVLLSAAVAALTADALPADASVLDLGDQRLKDLGRPERVFQLLHPELPAAFPPLLTVVRLGTGLPTEGAPFIGRHAELEAIEQRLAAGSVRLLTLTGPGGTGKTSLAVHAAERARPRYRDGACFVDLSDARDTDAVLTAIARVIGLGEIIERPLLEEVTDRLRDRQLLLVLDNFEQVAEAAGVVAQLLVDCPGITALVTSREPLEVRAEQVFAVPPLGLPPADPRTVSAASMAGSEAVQLFVDRAATVRRGFELTDGNAAAVGEICRRLDGLPLAIELAAARLALFSPEALRDRLGRRLELLRSGSRDRPERQQTLRATIEWSYQLLDPGEQRLFESFAAFADTDVVALEAVTNAVATRAASDGDDGSDTITVDAVDGLASLLAKSLVRQVDAAGGEPRFTMLETMREYASERLDEHPALGERLRRAQATYFADLAARLRPQLVGMERDQALSTMVAEVGNLRLAWRYWMAARDLDQLGKLADSLLILNDARGWYLDTVGLTSDLLAVLSSSATTPDRVSQEIALRTSLARALMATRGYTAEVEEAYERALELFERGDPVLADSQGIHQQFGVLRGLAGLYLMRAEFEKSDALGRQILDLAERHDDPAMRLEGRLVVGSALTFMNDLHGGLGLLDAAIASFDAMPRRGQAFRLGNEPRVSCLTTSGITLWFLGFPDRAVDRVRAGLELAAELDHPFTTAYARFHAGLLHLFRRDPEIVLARAVGVLEVADEHDFKIWTAVGSCLQGAAEAELGRFDEALARIRTGLELYQGFRTPPIFWPMLRYIEAAASLRAGRIGQAREAIDTGTAIIGSRPSSLLLPEFQLLTGDVLDAAAASDGADGQAGPSPAEPWYLEALAGATALDARMSALRASLRLVRLGDRAADPTGAREQLARLVDGFDEGFETADLKDARRLLDGDVRRPS